MEDVVGKMKFSSGINTTKLFRHNQDQDSTQPGMGKWTERENRSVVKVIV